jgi:hypothetical protein
MKVAYIAGRFRGPNAWAVERNIRKAEELAFAVAELGVMPLCPHTNTRFFDGTLTAGFWLDGTLELMRRCDAVIFTDDWRLSTGARSEYDEAIRLGIPTFFNTEQLERWLHTGITASVTLGMAK